MYLRQCLSARFRSTRDVVPTKTGTFSFTDSATGKQIGTAEFKPAIAPLGGTVFLVGEQKKAAGAAKPIEGVVRCLR
eukprot:SAG22_NODE_5875_length_937_cov_1.831742_1_plen_77_part_00